MYSDSSSAAGGEPADRGNPFDNTHIYIYIYTSACVCVYIYVYIHTLLDVYIHICVYIYKIIHQQDQSLGLLREYAKTVVAHGGSRRQRL